MTGQLYTFRVLTRRSHWPRWVVTTGCYPSNSAAKCTVDHWAGTTHVAMTLTRVFSSRGPLILDLTVKRSHGPVAGHCSVATERRSYLPGGHSPTR